MFAIPPPRSIYATDFSEYPLSSELSVDAVWAYSSTSNFTAIVGAVTAAFGGRAPTINKTTSDAARFVIFGPPGTLTDCEVLVCVKMDEEPAGSSDTVGLAISRYTDTTHYYIALPRKVSGAKKFEVGKESGSGGVALATVDKSWATTNYWYIRLQIYGTALKAKMWQRGTAEPASWDIEETDSDNTSGKVGLGTYHDDANYKCSWFAVAIGQNRAPFPSG